MSLAARMEASPSASLLVPDLPEHEYHGDPCPTPSLSSSIARTIIRSSAHHAWHEHPRFGGAAHEQSKEMTSGAIAHKLLLGKGSKVRIIEADSFRTKAAREERDAALAAGDLPCLAEKYAEAERVTEARRKELERLGIALPPGDSCEVSMFWKDMGLWMRARADAIDSATHTVYDLKETHGQLTMHELERHMAGMLYHIPAAAYIEGAERTHYETRGRWRFVFLFLEASAPHCVVPVVAGESFLELGRLQWARACKVWRHSVASGDFPRPPGGIVSARSFDLARESEGTYVENL